MRYIRPGELIGHVLPFAADRAPLGIAAVTDCEIIELDVRQLRTTVENDVAAALRMVAALNHRLEDSYATLAATAFGTMRERVAGHLLDLAHGTDASGRLAARVTQQELADSIGTAREVVARVLRELRDEGLVETGPRVIVLVDPGALAAQVGRWHIRRDGRT